MKPCDEPESRTQRYLERDAALKRGVFIKRTANAIVEFACATGWFIAIFLAWESLTAKTLVGCFLGWFATRLLLRRLVYVIVLKPLLDKINREHPIGDRR